MVRPCVARGFHRSVGFAVLHQCIRPLIGACCAPGHHGYQRACGLISCQASRAIWVTRVRKRREDRSSISFHPLADLGGKTGLCHRSLLISAVLCSCREAVPSSRSVRCAGHRAQGPSRLAVAVASVLAPAFAGHALYEAFDVKHYFTAFSTSFIPVSLFDLESRFFAPTHTCWKPARAGAVRAGRRSALASRSIVSRPRLDRPEHGGTLVVVGMTRPRGARCRGTRDSCRNLVSAGSQ